MLGLQDIKAQVRGDLHSQLAIFSGKNSHESSAAVNLNERLAYPGSRRHHGPEDETALLALGLVEKKNNIRCRLQIFNGLAWLSPGADKDSILQAGINYGHPAHGPAKDCGHAAELFQVIDQLQSTAAVYDLRAVHHCADPET